jgi:polar amino acid transport system substrate-binding protein
MIGILQSSRTPIRHGLTHEEPTMLKSLIGASAVLAFGLFAAAVPSPVAADDLDTVRERGVLRVALSGVYPPFSMTNDQNEVVGFDVDIAKEIAERLGVEAEIITTAWDGIIAGLVTGRYDTIIASMSITPERQEVVDFVGPYYSAGRTIFVSEASDLQSVDDLDGRTLGVTLGETHEEWARDQADRNWTLRTYRGLNELVLETRNGRIDGFVADSVAGTLAARESGTPLRSLELEGEDGAAVDVGIAIRKDNPELAQAMQEALDAMMEDGTYMDIAMEWIGSDIR